MPVRMPRITIGVKIVDDALDELARGIERNLNLRVAPPLRLADGPTHRTFSIALPQKRLVKLTSNASGGTYQASEVYPTAGGGSAIVPDGWTGVVVEWNGNSGIPTPYYAEVTYFGTSGDWRFQAGPCPGSSSTSTTGSGSGTGSGPTSPSQSTPTAS